jgi:hypothetical protein
MKINLFCRFVGAACEYRQETSYPESMRILVVRDRTTFHQFLLLLMNALRVADEVSVQSEFLFKLYNLSLSSIYVTFEALYFSKEKLFQ